MSAVQKYGGLGEEVCIVTDELLNRLVDEQAPEHVKAYGKVRKSNVPPPKTRNLHETWVEMS